MSVTAKKLIDAQNATASDVTYYTAPALTRTIIDKFTATNTTAGSINLFVNIIPAAGAVSATNLIIDTFAIAAHTCADMTQLQNQILAAGDQLSVKASAGASIVIRGSGRECT